MSEVDQMLDAVTEGEEAVITRDGKDVAVILPIDEYEGLVAAISDTETEDEDTP